MGRLSLRSWLWVSLLCTGLGCNSLCGAELAKAAPVPPLNDRAQQQLDQNVQTALWMQAYDRVAWATTDLLLKESKETLKDIGPVWFCVEIDHVWYALYGRFQDDAFDIAVCYQQTAKDKFEKVSPPLIADKDRFARAISLTLPEILETTRRTTVRFNYYIRGNQDLVEVYYLPAVQPEGKLAYGIEHSFLLNATGQAILSHEQFGKVLADATPDKQRTLTLEMKECALPTPQAIFTMVTCRGQFADILTHCRDGYFGIESRNGSMTCGPTSGPAPNPSEFPVGLGAIPADAPQTR
jgi:hypothetical protein